MKILVCDDFEDRCEDSAVEVRKASDCQVDTLAAGGLTDTLVEFFEAVGRYLQGPRKADVSAAASKFDGYDLVILDNNLTELDIKGTRMTAESIIGYVRAFSEAPYVVSLNKNPDVDFDLRHLAGDYFTRADLAVNSNHLSIPALWKGHSDNSMGKFAPWYWRPLLEAPEQRRGQIKTVATELARPVLESLGFSPGNAAALLPLARGSLTPSAPLDGRGSEPTAIESITFLDVFLGKERSLPALQDRRVIAEAAKDGNARARQIVSRVVAADVEHWLRCDVLAPQDTLVDVPHLLMRLPPILGKEVVEVSAWNRAVRSTSEPYGLDDITYGTHIASWRFQHDVWGLPPCFWWLDIQEDTALDKQFRDAGRYDWVDAVFCEDTSQFVCRTTRTNAPTEFVTQLEGSWERRYVQQMPGFKYAPKTRLALSW